MSRISFRRITNVLLVILAAQLLTIVIVGCHFTSMPGSSFSGQLAPLTLGETALAGNLRKHVDTLAKDIGQRNLLNTASLEFSATYISDSLTKSGYEVALLPYNPDGIEFNNIEATLKGTDKPDDLIVVAAHYDSAPGTKGANDNASGVAGVLELARMMASTPHKRTIKFVFLVNEEPPYFQTDRMGAFVYASSLRNRNVNVTAMLSLETIGYYTDEPGTQLYPFPFNLAYPDTGNFIGFISTTQSRKLVRKALKIFRQSTDFPSEGAAIPAMFPGADWSDHWGFMVNGYEGIMITDTAPYRYKHYHTYDDTPDKLDYERMARVVMGIKEVITALASE